MEPTEDDDPFAPLPWQRKRSREEVDQDKASTTDQSVANKSFETTGGSSVGDPPPAAEFPLSQITPESDDGKKMKATTPMIGGMHNLGLAGMGHEQSTPYQNQFPSNFCYYQTADGSWCSSGFPPFYHQNISPEQLDQVQQQADSSISPQYHGLSSASAQFVLNSLNQPSPVQQPFQSAHFFPEKAEFQSPHVPLNLPAQSLQAKSLRQDINDDNNVKKEGNAKSNSSDEAKVQESTVAQFNSRLRDETNSQTEAILPPAKKLKQITGLYYDTGNTDTMNNEPLIYTESSSTPQASVPDYTQIDAALTIDRLLPAQYAARNTDATFHAIAYLSVAHEGLCSPDTQIVSESDKSLLTDYVFYILKQLRSCHMSEADRKCRGRKREKISTGYAGLQCIHCINDENPRKFFWSSVDRLANSFTEISGHIFKCWRCPQQTKDALIHLKHLHPYQIAARPRGSQKIFFRRLWRRLHDGEDDGGSEGETNATATNPPASRASSPSEPKREEEGSADAK